MKARMNSARLVLIVALVSGAWLRPLQAAADEPTPPQQATCVKWTSEARFVGFAFNHLVLLTNNCDYAVSCSIKTDVNPKVETVVLKPKESKTHLTFRGSPASVFKPEVLCKKN